MFVKDRPKNPTAVARKLKMPYSYKKMLACCLPLRKKHIDDASAIASSISKKGGPWLVTMIESVRRNAIRKGLDDNKLFIKELYVGKGIRGRMIDIKGRGKFGMITRPYCHVNLIVEEKPFAEFYKLMMTGKAPQTFGAVMRRVLY